MGPPPPSTQALPDNLPFRLVSSTIGEGAYASIRKARPLNSNTIVAVKFINKNHAFKQGRLSSKQIQIEIQLHKFLGRHQHIIQFLAYGDDSAWIWIAMELAEGGDLFDKIEADEGVGEDIAHFYFSQLIGAVGYMHSKGIAHRDIKPENILLSGEGDLKLADFGLAALFQKDGVVRLCNTICGSPPYIAPEIVSGRRKQRSDVLERGYAPNISDIWSCGVVLFVLLVGNTPWDEPTMQSYEFKEYVDTSGRTTDELWQKIPPEMTSLLRGMLKLDPRERFTLDEVRRHPWFTRQNPYLNASGRAADQVVLATQMLEALHIDFTIDPSPSQQLQYRRQQQHLGALSLDLNNIATSGFHLAATQPETPVTPANDDPFDWERPPRAGMLSDIGAPFISASQPVTAGHAGSNPNRKSLPYDLMDRLTADPALTQFTPTPSVPLSLTQAARHFRDIVPAQRLTRFISSFPMAHLLPLLTEALHQLGIPAPPFSDAVLAGTAHEAYIRVKTVDGRRQGLNGGILVEKVGNDLVEVHFRKIKGDPVEWRRFFKRIVVLCKDAVFVPTSSQQY